MARSTAEIWRRARERPRSLIKAVDEFRRKYCLEALQAAGGNVTQAAREAGINRQYLQCLIKRYDLRVRPKMRGNWGDLTD
jgi:DNA-binding NtrC family response regulator